MFCHPLIFFICLNCVKVLNTVYHLSVEVELSKAQDFKARVVDSIPAGDIKIWFWIFHLFPIQMKSTMTVIKFKASAHSFKQFISRLWRLSFSLSMHLYNSDGRHAWFHLHGTSRPDRSASEATKYKMKNSLFTMGLEPSALRFQVWCSTYWASRAWWMVGSTWM